MTQFTFYEIYKDVMEMLDDDATRGQFMKAICKFMFEEEPVKPPKGNKSEYFWENIIDVMTESKEAEKNGKRPKRLNMKMKRFTFQYAYYKAILLMTDEEIWQYIKAIYGYMVDGVEPKELSNNVALYFNLAKRKLDISKTRSIVGKHGGKLRKQTAEITLEQFLSAHRQYLVKTLFACPLGTCFQFIRKDREVFAFYKFNRIAVKIISDVSHYDEITAP